MPKYHVVSARNPGPWTGAGNNTFLLPGRVPTLIDAGVGDAGHVDEIASRLADAPLATVVVTHGHVDHASGAPALAARWPAAAFLKLPWPDRDARWPVEWRPLADDDLVDAGDGRLRVMHTPGHAPDHVCLFDEGERTLFCGDLVVAGSTVVIPGGRGGDLAAYIQSLQRVLALGPRLLLPAHGPPIDRPETVITAYLDHRRTREMQILAELSRGAVRPEEIVTTIYRGLRAELRNAARDSVLAHLIKLRDEGRARQEPDGAWRLTE
jgi:glyoxylase-like metal-dependent hydrolase (beta-lactamase superfamily II)